MDSFLFRISRSFAHANIENTEIIKIAKLQIVAIRESTQLIRKEFSNVAIKTITRKTIFTNQTCTYHAIKSLSSSVKDGSDFTLFFTNGAKNITAAIAESLVSDEMMFSSFSIVNN